VIAQMSEDYYYFVSCSRGAGAAPLPEHEVSSQKSFLLVAHEVQGQSPLPEREVSSQKSFFLSFCAAAGGAK